MDADLALRGTIWLSVLAWASAEALKRSGPGRPDAARLVWSAGAILLVAHTLLAFHVRHHWSHAAALAETARQSKEVAGVAVGAGLYLNYLFVLTWIADAAWWWGRPAAYLARPRVLDAAVLLFFLFMFVNGAVVFAAGPMRIVGAAAVAAVVLARLVPARAQ